MSFIRKNIWNFINTLLGLINFVILLVYMNFYNRTPGILQFDAISIQIAMMDIILVVFALGLTAAGIIGYNQGEC